ncbi:MAG TPA: hypothetical protein VJ835_02955 [Fimbriimonadaceae bacterium]|nr:hypothetical protein [Fimbriimonadaceae bacterium]
MGIEQAKHRLRTAKWRLSNWAVAKRADVLATLRAPKTRKLASQRGTDLDRWAKDSSYEDFWRERNEIIAAAILPGTRVLEFGAGLQSLRGLLDPTCKYQPTDLVARTPDCLICDLNVRPFPDLPDAEVAVLSGVLEYVHEPVEALRFIGRLAPTLICSYATVKNGADTSDRHKNGFFNHFSEDEFLQTLQCAGYSPQKVQPWGDQIIVVAVLDGS